MQTILVFPPVAFEKHHAQAQTAMTRTQALSYSGCS